MSAIDWIEREDGSETFVKDLKVTLRDGKFIIIFNEFDNETRVKIEGKIILDKVTDFQQKNGVITYITNNGSPESYPFTISGQFSDENYDEFKGDWLEERVLYSVTVSLDEIEMPIEDSKNEESIDISQAEKLLASFAQINASLPQDKVDGEDSDNIDPLSEITLDLDKAKQLIQDFKKLEKPPQRKKAFLEIIGLSHLETVSSKVLAFFLNTYEVHDLKDLCIQALYDCILGRNKSDNEPAISTLSVEREVSTEENSRIDIIIDTYDDLIIIENKLFHSVNNPFESYVHYGKLRRGEKNGHYIILGIHKPEILPEYFKFINHFDLGNAIRNRLSDYLIDADQHYLTLLIDYLHALDNFNPNSRIGKMEQAIVNFFGNSHSQLEEIMNASWHFIYYAELKVQAMKSLLEENNLDIFINEHRNEACFEWLGYTAYTEIISKAELALKNGISFDFCLGCYSKGINLHIEFNKNLIGRGAPKDCNQRLKNILNDLEIQYDTTDDWDDDAEFVYIKKFNWNENPEIVVSQLIPVIEKLKKVIDSHN